VFIHESPATCPRRLQGETEVRDVT
jgi:hypothetical protein